MKAVILAAGKGERLRPFTEEVPKCMVQYQGRELIDYILESMDNCGLTDISIVSGYKQEKLADKPVKHYHNARFATTNMVTTLFEAQAEFNDDLVISYADIIYKDHVLQALIDAPGPVSVVVDRNWKDLWSQRMDNPLADAETLKVNEEGFITELGKKPTDYSEIMGQYIGLVKFSAEALPQIVDFYNKLDRNATYDGKDFDNMYMTSFLQLIIDKLFPVQPVWIENSWMEFDTVPDLAIENYL